MATKQINQYLAASTIDAVNDQLLIDPAGTGNYLKINRNTYLGITGTPMDISTTQNVSNKNFQNSNSYTAKDGSLTLQNTSDTTKQAKFSLSGITTGNTRTITLPDYNATMASLAGTETLTNKTLTAPTISGGSVDNATVTVDTISGHTSSNTGTIYGVSVSSGTLGSSALATNAVQAAQLAQNAIKLGYAQITNNFATSSASLVDVTSLTSTVTVPAGGRDVKVTISSSGIQNTADGNSSVLALVEGSTVLQSWFANNPFTNGNVPISVIWRISAPSPGSHTYKVQLAAAAGTATLLAGATPSVSVPGPAFILVEAI